MGEKFWTEDLSILFTTPKFFPTADMSRDEKLNALSRLALVIAAVLYYINYEHWLAFLAVALLVIVCIKYNSKPGDAESFTLVPTYPNPNMETTTVAPLFAEEWQVYPPAYDIYDNYATPETFKEPIRPQSYPYGQYLTRTNLLPSDEYATHMLNGGPKQARDYVNGAFLRHSLAHRDNMTRLYKKKLQRRFRHNMPQNDTFSPFHSY